MTKADDLKRRMRLVDMVGDLRKAGNYYIGPCPFCGGKDRFNVKPADDGDLWLCRKCAPGKYQDVISFLMRRDGSTYAEVVGESGGGRPVAAIARPAAILSAPQLAQPPDEGWQIAAMVAAGDCANYLRGDTADARAAMRYLTAARCLKPSTLDAATIGYNPDWRDVGNRCWLAPGVVIPGMVDGALWYVQVRTTAAARAQAAERGRKIDKYHALTGSRLGALYQADRALMADVVFVTEGEFDALVLGQSLPPGAAAVTMGSAGSKPDGITWARYFAAAKDIILLMDADAVGQRALADWQRILPRARAASLPDGSKDISAYAAGGGNVAGWARGIIDGSPEATHSALKAAEVI